MYSKSKLLEKALLQLGFEPLEILVYENLFQSKSLNIKSLASKFGTNRVRIYQILDKLQEIGLLHYTKGVAREFRLESPNKILALLKFQETERARVTKDFEDYLPDLLTNFFSYDQKPVFKTFEGRFQFVSIFNQLLEELGENDCILALGEGEDFNQIIDTEYFKIWMKKRIAKKIRVKILGRHDNQFLKEIAHNSERELRELKFLNPDFQLGYGNMFILSHKIIIWNTVEVRAVVIENKAIAQFFIGIFEGIWNLQN